MVVKSGRRRCRPKPGQISARGVGQELRNDRRYPVYAKTLSSLAGVYRRPGVLGPHWIRPTLRMRNDEPKRYETSAELSRFL